MKSLSIFKLPEVGALDVGVPDGITDGGSGTTHINWIFLFFGIMNMYWILSNKSVPDETSDWILHRLLSVKENVKQIHVCIGIRSCFGDLNHFNRCRCRFSWISVGNNSILVQLTYIYTFSVVSQNMTES